MPDYVRPELPKQVFYDDQGAVIDYGNRWRWQSPPEGTYSVSAHPERFAPILTVADALIDHLRDEYDLRMVEDIACAQDLVRNPDNVSRAIRLVPAGPNSAALTFVFTTDPCVMVHAGLLHDFTFPGCGCDACDESLEGLADELESLAFAVTGGGYTESVDGMSPLRLLGLNVGYEIRGPGGYRSHRSRGDIHPRDRLASASKVLGRLPNGWQPWTRRSKR